MSFFAPLRKLDSREAQEPTASPERLLRPKNNIFFSREENFSIADEYTHGAIIVRH